MFKMYKSICIFSEKKYLRIFYIIKIFVSMQFYNFYSIKANIYLNM